MERGVTIPAHCLARVFPHNEKGGCGLRANTFHAPRITELTTPGSAFFFLKFLSLAGLQVLNQLSDFENAEKLWTAVSHGFPEIGGFERNTLHIAVTLIRVSVF